MNVYTYTEARRELAALLDRASEDGAVRIQRRNGQSFVLRPERQAESPFDDVKGVNTDLSNDDVVDLVRASRERQAR